MKHLIDRLEREKTLPAGEMARLIGQHTPQDAAYLFERAVAVRRAYYGDKVFMRGLIEFTSYCQNDCYYCGLRKSNKAAERYRLTSEQILECCELGYSLGFRTFVLQGGEDAYWTDECMAAVVSAIKTGYLTLARQNRSRVPFYCTMQDEDSEETGEDVMPTTPEQPDFAHAQSFVLCPFQPTKSACAAAVNCLSGTVTAPFQRQRSPKV